MRVGHRRSFELDRLLRRADDQEAWTSALRAVLPDDLAPHCWVTDLRGDTIVVATDHPAWATKARFCLPNALPGLQNLAAFAQVQQSIVRVVSDTAPGSTDDSGVRLDDPAETKADRRSRLQAFQTIRNMLDSDR